MKSEDVLVNFAQPQDEAYIPWGFFLIKISVGDANHDQI